MLVRKNEKFFRFTTIVGYRGPSDPLHGDALNQAVRTAAQQAVEAIFERNESGDRNRNMYEGMQSNFNQQTGASGGGISSWIGMGSNSTANDGYQSSTTNTYTSGGMGSHNYSNSGGISYGGGKYQGIGNPQMQQQNASQSGGYLETIKNYVPTLSGITSYLPGGSKKPYQTGEFPSFINSDQSMGTYNPAVVPSGFSSSGRSDNYHGHGSRDWESSSSPSSSSPVSSNGSSSTTLEQKLVDEFTNVAGVKLQPTRTEISQFVSKCSKVDINAISQMLHKKLEHKQWQVRLKALFAIEALIKANNDEVRSYFVDCYDEIGEYTVAVQESVATRARRVST